jgi:hypothetical protein
MISKRHENAGKIENFEIKNSDVYVQYAIHTFKKAGGFYKGCISVTEL